MSVHVVTDPGQQREAVDVIKDLIEHNFGKPMRFTISRQKIPIPLRDGDKIQRYRKGDMRIAIDITMGGEE